MKLLKPFSLFFSALLLTANVYSAQPSMDDNKTDIELKPTPQVTEESVQGIFGNNLETKDPLLSGLLLAIAIDHTSKGSPHINEEIGIPYIVERTPLYWGKELKEGNEDIDVFVNNALLLLFTEHSISDSNKVADHLLNKAANKGYWPAEFYIAERNLLTHLVQGGGSNHRLLPDEIKFIADETMDRYNTCASMGFPICKFRIGFWLSSAESTFANGISVLRDAIGTTLNDRRYKDSLDTAVIMAATLIVEKGAKAGIDKLMRDEYQKLLESKIGEAESRHTQTESRRL